MPLKIALFTYSTKPRGSVVHTLALGEALQELGHQVCVYGLDKDGSGFYRPLRCDAVSVPAQPVAGGIDALIKQRIQELADYLSEVQQRYDIYHAQDCISANALSVLRSRRRISHVVRTVHHIEDYNSPYLRECQDNSIRNPDRCFCVSSYWQAALLQQYGITASSVINGVNTRRFSSQPNGLEAELKARLGLTGSPIYLTVGGIEPRKNSIALLQAFAGVLTQYPQAQLAIAGGATLFDYQDYRDDFFAIADSLGISVGQSLILPGVIADDELPVLYRLANAFVFPSLKEGWGLVVLEAMASGIPVIASDQPPFTEFLTSDDALLVEPANVEAIAQAMQTILIPDLSQRLACHGIEVANRYTWEKSAQQHLTHYNSLLQTPTYARNSLQDSVA